MNATGRPRLGKMFLFISCALVLVGTERLPITFYAQTCLLFFLLSVMDWGELSPRELFSRCARVPEDRNAWREFLRRYEKSLALSICKVIGFPGDRQYELYYDETWQNLYARLLTNDRRVLLAFNGNTEGEAHAYLKKVAVCAALNTIRKETAKVPSRSLDDDALELPAHEDTGSTLIARATLEQCLERHIRGRNKEHKIFLFKLFALEDLRPAEIAMAAGINMSAHAIEIQISRMRKKMQKCFDRR
ncbi:hypothetical protein HUU05_02305 [candidate division KSB1 bacterium]|nr:hypothetical protein [candidate division KSB1 bacterium]